MAKLSKNNTYAILWLKSQGWEIENISKELNVPTKQIDAIELPKPNQSDQLSQVRKTSKDFMINQTANKTNGVTIMTKEASMMNDDHKKNQNKPNNSRNQNIIHKIS